MTAAVKVLYPLFKINIRWYNYFRIHSDGNGF